MQARQELKQMSKKNENILRRYNEAEYKANTKIEALASTYGSIQCLKYSTTTDQLGSDKLQLGSGDNFILGTDSISMFSSVY